MGGENKIKRLPTIDVVASSIDTNYPTGLTWDEYLAKRLTAIRDGAADRYEAQLAPLNPKGVFNPFNPINTYYGAYKDLKSQIEKRNATGYYLTHPYQRLADEETANQYVNNSYNEFLSNCINTTTAMYGDEYRQSVNANFTDNPKGFTKVIDYNEPIYPNNILRGDLIRFENPATHTNMITGVLDDRVIVRNAGGDPMPIDLQTKEYPIDDEGRILTQEDIEGMSFGIPVLPKSIYRFTGDPQLINRLKGAYQKYQERGKKKYGGNLNDITLVSPFGYYLPKIRKYKNGGDANIK